MKLQQVAIGGRFEYEGKVFVKTGPLTATSETGGQQLIPRYAILKPLDVPENKLAPGMSLRRLDPQKVRKAFAQFCQEVDDLIDPERRSDWLDARHRFLSNVSLPRDAGAVPASGPESS